MLPIGDDKLKNARPQIFTVLFVLINIAVFFYELSLGPALEGFIREFGVVPAKVTNGENIYSLITSIFLHGGWMHLIGNMLFLWIFGDNIEAVLGHMAFIVFYMIGGLAGTLGHVLTDPSSIIPSIGASGAISALLGAYLVLFPKSGVRTFIPFIFSVIRIPAIAFLGIWILIQIFNGMSSLAATEETSGVAWFAHIGGFVFGVVVGFMYRGKKRTLFG